MPNTFDELVAMHLKSMKDTQGSTLMPCTIWDESKKPVVTRRKKFLSRKEHVTTETPQLTVAAPFAAAYLCLSNCRSELRRITLPSDSPVPGQVDAAIVRVCELAAARTSVHVWDEAESAAAHQAVKLAAQVAAVVTLAVEREAVIHHIDAASLRRTAEALTADLDAARAHLAADPIDRELANTSH